MPEWIATMPPHSARRLRVKPLLTDPLRSRPAFLLLKDLQRNRFTGRLTRKIMRSSPYISGVYCGKKRRGERYRRLSGAVVPAARRINSRSRNIFNGLLRVPVNEKIPALNSI
jgi:hypothetical protein